jgi:putative iron-regulated protein
LRPTIALGLVLAIGACKPPSPEAAAVRQYVVDLDANYKDIITALEALQSAVDAFVANPSADGLVAAKNAWLLARPVYGEAEYSRFYGGPIDQAQGGMNEWPIDENFIDYTAANPTGGIINDPVNYPQLNSQVLATSDQRGGIENLSTGFHAIEFLLWGQRTDQTLGPGTRAYTDYVDAGTAAHQDRRRNYLKIAADLLVTDMRGLEAQWDTTDPQSYASMLLAAPPHDGVTKIMRGLSSMAIAELLYERLSDPYITQAQKDEESCFSESTWADLDANALGVEDAYLGRYGNLHGPSVSDLVKAKNPALDASMRQQLSAIRSALASIPQPFDHAVLAPVDSDAHLKVKAAIDSFSSLQTTLEHVVAALGVTVNI